MEHRQLEAFAAGWTRTYRVRRSLMAAARLGLISLVFLAAVASPLVVVGWLSPLIGVFLFFVSAAIGLVGYARQFWAMQKPTQELAIVHQLDAALTKEDGLVTSLTIGPESELHGRAGELAQILRRRVSRMAETADQRLALPKPPIWQLVVWLIAAFGLGLGAILWELAQQSSEKSGSPAAIADGSDSRSNSSSAVPSKGQKSPEGAATRVTAPSSGKPDADGDSTQDSGNSSDAGPGSGLGGQQGNSEGTTGTNSTAQPGERTSEPRFLAPGKSEQGGTHAPEVGGNVDGKAVGESARLPWERPTEAPGTPETAPKPEGESGKAADGLPTGERRRPPLRRPPPVLEGESKPYVEQPLRITPEVRDGDRKSIPVTREVYEPGAAEGTGRSSSTGEGEGGIPAKADFPARTAPMPRGSLSEEERGWLELWLRRFGQK